MAEGVSTIAGTFAHWHRVAMFNVIGFIACAMRGKLDKYAYLLAHAKHENRADYTGFAFSYKNPWAMWAGPLTSRRKGSLGPDGPDGNTAIYGSWWSAWFDRIEYDDKKGNDDVTSCKAYANQVFDHGWFGDDTSEAKRDEFVNGIVYQYEKNGNWFPKLLDGSTGIAGKVARWVASFIIVGIVLWLLYLLVMGILKLRKLWKEGKKGR